jgi:hypothetical protein
MSARQQAASDLAYDIGSMIRTCVLACDPVSQPNHWNGDNGIERTLEVADRLMEELIDKIDKLERLEKQATAST